eukprot:GFUD01108132.1.p1 GENE.GFUD01108132.1~~GFUD01108132.1.p1  ORF type:complete len:141 (+),score=28.17 GFUD01108132.1:91-513(+)
MSSKLLLVLFLLCGTAYAPPGTGQYSSAYGEVDLSGSGVSGTLSFQMYGNHLFTRGSISGLENGLYSFRVLGMAGDEDLGNMEVDSSPIEVDFADADLKLGDYGSMDIAGKTVVVLAEDDNGARVASGLVRLVSKMDFFD